MRWDDHRRADESINLHSAANAWFGYVTPQQEIYLGMVEDLKPIKSRQVAASTLATSWWIQNIWCSMNDQYFGDS